MKCILASLAALMFSVGAVAQTQGTATITGYDVAQYGVEGQIEQQLSVKVERPIASALPQAQNDELFINIIGSADHTGPKGKNEDYGQLRADQVRTVLSWKFPKARIVIGTKGSATGVREVQVTWKFIAAPKKEKDVSTIIGISAVVAGILLGAILLFWLSMKRSPKQKKEEVFQYDREGTSYFITVRRRKTCPKHPKGCWETPFPDQKDSGTFNCRETLGEVQRVIDLFMGRLFNKPVVQELIANRTIKTKK